MKNRGRTIFSLSAPFKLLPWQGLILTTTDTFKLLPLLSSPFLSFFTHSLDATFLNLPPPPHFISLHTSLCSAAFTSPPFCFTSHSPLLPSPVPPFHVSRASISLCPLFLASPPPSTCHNLSRSPCSPVRLYVFHPASLNRPCCLNGITC